MIWFRDQRRRAESASAFGARQDNGLFHFAPVSCSENATFCFDLSAFADNRDKTRSRRLITPTDATATIAHQSAATRADGRPYHLLAVGLLTTVGLGVRLRYLHQPMRYDEAYSYLFFVHVPLSTTLSDYSLPNQHILNSLLMRLCAGLFGNAPWALRLPAFAFGVATVPATYFSLRRLFGADAALIATALVAASAPLIVYATNARGYSLIVLLFLGVLAVSAALQQETSRRGWFWLVLLSVIGLYTIPIMLYAMGGVFIWHLARAWSRARSEKSRRGLTPIVRGIVYVVLLTALLYLPVVLRMGIGPLIANDWVTARTPAAFVAELPSALRALWQSWHGGMPLPIVLGLVAGVAVFALHAPTRRSTTGLVLSVLLWCLALLLITLRPPFPRVWLFLLPLYFGVAAAGLAGVLERFAPKRQAALALVLILCGWSAFAVIRSDVVLESEGPLFPDAEEVVAYLATEAKPGDGVYVRTPADAPVWYYTWRRGLPDTMLRLKYNAPRRVLVVINEKERQTIEGIVAVTPLRFPEFGAPVALRRFRSAHVYEIRREPDQ